MISLDPEKASNGPRIAHSLGAEISKIFWGRAPRPPYFGVQSVLCSSVRIQKPVNKFSGAAHDPCAPHPLNKSLIVLFIIFLSDYICINIIIDIIMHY